MFHNNPYLPLMHRYLESFNNTLIGVRVKVTLKQDKRWLTVELADPVTGAVFQRGGSSLSAAMSALLTTAEHAASEGDERNRLYREFLQAGLDRVANLEASGDAVAETLGSVKHYLTEELRQSEIGNDRTWLAKRIIRYTDTLTGQFALLDTLMVSETGSSPVTVLPDASTEHSDL